MPNSGASQAVLENPAVIIQRVSSLEIGLREINQHLDSFGRRMDEQSKNTSDKIDQLFSGMDKRFSEQITNVNNQLAERGRTPWGLLIGAMSVLMVVVQGYSSMQFGPVREDITGLVASVTALRDNTVPLSAFTEFKSTYENNRLTSRQDYDNRFKGMSTVLDAQVPRGEHERVWAGQAERMADLQRQIQANADDKQRQIDELKSSQASTYGVRDVIMDYRERLDRLEQRRQTMPVN